MHYFIEHITHFTLTNWSLYVACPLISPPTGLFPTVESEVLPTVELVYVSWPEIKVPVVTRPQHTLDLLKQHGIYLVCLLKVVV